MKKEYLDKEEGCFLIPDELEIQDFSTNRTKRNNIKLDMHNSKRLIEEMKGNYSMVNNKRNYKNFEDLQLKKINTLEESGQKNELNRYILNDIKSKVFNNIQDVPKNSRNHINLFDNEQLRNKFLSDIIMSSNEKAGENTNFNNNNIFNFNSIKKIKNNIIPAINNFNNFNVSYQDLTGFKKIKYSNIMKQFLESNDINSYFKGESINRIEKEKSKLSNNLKKNLSRILKKKNSFNFKNKKNLIDKLKNYCSLGSKNNILEITDTQKIINKREAQNKQKENDFKVLNLFSNEINKQAIYQNQSSAKDEEDHIFSNILKSNMEPSNIIKKIPSSAENNFLYSNKNSKNQQLFKSLLDFNDCFPFTSDDNENYCLENNIYNDYNLSLSSKKSKSNVIDTLIASSQISKKESPTQKKNHHKIVNKKTDFYEDDCENALNNLNIEDAAIKKIFTKKLKDSKLLDDQEQIINLKNIEYKVNSVVAIEKFDEKNKIEYHSFDEENLLNTNSYFISDSLLDKLMNMNDPNMFINVIEKIILNNIVYSVFSKEKLISAGLNPRKLQNSSFRRKEFEYNIFNCEADLNYVTDNGNNNYYYLSSPKINAMIQEN